METANRQKKPNDGRPQGHLGFEATLWATTDNLPGNRDAAEYKHAVLGLIFETLRSVNKRQCFCST